MHKAIAVILTIISICTVSINGCKKESTTMNKKPDDVPAPAAAVSATSDTDGEKLFKEFCAACHPDGSNVLNPQKTLHTAVLAQYKITRAEDMIRLLRDPGPGMRKFEPETITDDEARKIYQYVVTTFR